jgi:hypothetical protein
MTARKPSPLEAAVPFLCAAVLLALLIMPVFAAWGNISARRPLGTNDYRARVRTALESVPYKIGPAVGLDAPPTPAAQKLLSPNKIIERRYIDPTTGAGFSILIVHCGDVRDMIGHFPPVCYPANGWNPRGSSPVELEINGEHANAIRYDFSRVDEVIERRMSVLNFFVIPEEGATFFPSMDAVERASRSSDTGGLGVAQVQIVMPEESAPQWQQTIVRETLAAISPALRTISQGIKK